MNYCEEQLKAAEKKAWEERIKRVNERLKSCPCCGGKAEVKEGIDTDGRCGYVTVYIECSRCGLRTEALITDGYFDEWHTPEEAAELWNRRYSGINDKNGNPICDGDYIRITGENWSDEIPGVYKVEYSVSEFTWYLTRVYEYEYFSNGLHSFADLNLSMFTDEIELVEKED